MHTKHPLTEAHAQETDVRTLFGFWIYIMTDCILFATFFATYIVLQNNTYGGPSGKELFELPFVLTETMLLLTSSFTCGLGMLSAHREHKSKVIFWFLLTFLLGLGFLGMELHEFSDLVSNGNSWQRSGFLSAFFTLVATHGLHVTFGLLWIVILLKPIFKDGITQLHIRRLSCLSLFWHFLDVVWIFIFTIVYLMGAI